MTKHEKFWIFAQVSKLQKSEAKERESLDLLLRRNDEFECLFSVLVKKNITYIKKSAIDKKTKNRKWWENEYNNTQRIVLLTTLNNCDPQLTPK